MRIKLRKNVTVGVSSSSALYKYIDMPFTPYPGLTIELPNEYVDIKSVSYFTQTEEITAYCEDDETGKDYCRANNKFSYADSEPKQYQSLMQSYLKKGWKLGI